MKKLNLEEAKAKFPVDTPVWYHPENDDRLARVASWVRGEVFEDLFNDYRANDLFLVKIKDVTAPVNVEHLEPRQHGEQHVPDSLKAPNVNEAVADVAKKYGVNPAMLQSMAYQESSENKQPIVGAVEVLTTPKAINVTTFMQQLREEIVSRTDLAQSEGALDVLAEYQHDAEKLQDSGQFADGYHTFDELYAHRVRLFVGLMHAHRNRAWWSTHYADGSGVSDGKFLIAGINTPEGAATYHIPKTETDHLPQGTFKFYAPEFDGHTADDVLQRLLSLHPISSPPAVIYHYSASINTARGSVSYDGVLEYPRPIAGIDDYHAVRAIIAEDGGQRDNPGLVNVLSLTAVGGGQ